MKSIYHRNATRWKTANKTHRSTVALLVQQAESSLLFFNLCIAKFLVFVHVYLVGTRKDNDTILISILLLIPFRSEHLCCEAKYFQIQLRNNIPAVKCERENTMRQRIGKKYENIISINHKFTSEMHLRSEQDKLYETIDKTQQKVK